MPAQASSSASVSASSSHEALAQFERMRSSPTPPVSSTASSTSASPSPSRPISRSRSASCSNQAAAQQQPHQPLWKPRSRSRLSAHVSPDDWTLVDRSPALATGTGQSATGDQLAPMLRRERSSHSIKQLRRTSSASSSLHRRDSSRPDSVVVADKPLPPNPHAFTSSQAELSSAAATSMTHSSSASSLPYATSAGANSTPPRTPSRASSSRRDVRRLTHDSHSNGTASAAAVKSSEESIMATPTKKGGPPVVPPKSPSRLASSPSLQGSSAFLANESPPPTSMTFTSDPNAGDETTFTAPRQVDDGDYETVDAPERVARPPKRPVNSSRQVSATTTARTSAASALSRFSLASSEFAHSATSYTSHGGPAHPMISPGASSEEFALNGKNEQPPYHARAASAPEQHDDDKSAEELRRIERERRRASVRESLAPLLQLHAAVLDQQVDSTAFSPTSVPPTARPLAGPRGLKVDTLKPHALAAAALVRAAGASADSGDYDADVEAEDGLGLASSPRSFRRRAKRRSSDDAGSSLVNVYGDGEMDDDEDDERFLKSLTRFAGSLPSPVPREQLPTSPTELRALVEAALLDGVNPNDEAFGAGLGILHPYAASQSPTTAQYRHEVGSLAPPAMPQRADSYVTAQSAPSPTLYSTPETNHSSELSLAGAGAASSTTHKQGPTFGSHLSPHSSRERSRSRSPLYDGARHWGQANADEEEVLGARNWGEEEWAPSPSPTGKIVVDLSGTALDDTEDLPSSPTHVILAHIITPALLPAVLPSLISSALRVLDISWCKQESLDLLQLRLPHLEELNVSGNLLGELPAHLASLTSLRVFAADDCALTELCTRPLSSLSRLHTFSVRRNRLRSLPGWLARLPSLEMLLVDDNDFRAEWRTLAAPLALGDSEAMFPSSFVDDSLTAQWLLTSPSLSVNTADTRSSYGFPSPAQVLSHGLLSASPSLAPSPTVTTPHNLSSFVTSPNASQSALTPPPPSAAPLQRRPSVQESSRPPSRLEEPTGKWSKVLKKVSLGKKRPSGEQLTPQTRAFSDPVVSTTVATPRSRTSSGSRHTSRRTSFLKLSPIPPLFQPGELDEMHDLAEEGDEEHERQQAQARADEMHDKHSRALQRLLAYLQDLDDLSSDLEDPGVPPSTAVPVRSRSSSREHSIYTSPSAASLGNEFRRASQSGSITAYSHGDSDELVEHLAAPAAEDAPKLRLDVNKRDKVVQEILETEVTYVRGLDELVDIYVAPAAATVTTATKRDTVVPASERRAVFGNVEAIRDFHKSIFMPDLRAAIADDSDSNAVAENVARVFIRHADVLKIYSSYVNAFDSALARLSGWRTVGSSILPLVNGSKSPIPGSPDPSASGMSTSQRKRIKAFLKRCRMSPRHSQISLESYLLLPVQRIPRYRLLLETLVSSAPVLTSPPRANPILEEALELVSAVASAMNESKREQEGRDQLLYWQQRIGQKFRSPLVQPHRSLVKSGQMTLAQSVKRMTVPVEDGRDGAVFVLKQQPRNVRLVTLLCSDFLVFLHEPMSSDASAPVDLFGVMRFSASPRKRGTSTTVRGENKSMLRIACDDKTIFYVECPSPSDAAAWAQAINMQSALN